jgi:hypothetical protein
MEGLDRSVDHAELASEYKSVSLVLKAMSSLISMPFDVFSKQVWQHNQSRASGFLCRKVL